MRTLTCKHKIWRENWLHLRPYLKAFVSKYLENAVIIEAIMACTNSLKRFLKKTLGTEKHKDK